MKVLLVTLLALLALSSARPLTRLRGLGFVSRTSHEESSSETSSEASSSCSSSDSNSTDSEDTVPIVSLQRIASNLTTASSLSFAVPKGHSKEFLFVTQQTGQVLVIDIDQVIAPNDTEASTKWDDKDITPYLLLDLSDDVVELGTQDERGLLAAAFHPNFTDNGRFFVLYSSRTPAREGSSNPNNSRSCKASNGSLSSDCKLEGVDHVLKLVEYKVIEFPQNISAPVSNDTASSSSAQGTADFSAIGKVQLVRNVLFIDQPFNNHLAAQSLAFNAKDGWLYLGLGDGGCQDDPFEYSLNKDSLFAKVVRIDVDGIESRNVSCSEPVQTFSKLAEACKNVSQSVEAFAYGVRNPAGIEFVADKSKSNWAAVVPDAAGAQYDEINYMVDSGAFYGYALREGFVCVNRSDLCSSASSNANASAFGADASAVQPVAVVAHDDPSTLYPSAIVGGHMYNGSISALKNKYVFASVASTKKGKLIGQGSLLFTDLSKLSSSNKGLFNRTVTVSDCGNNATNVDSESSEASEASEASSSSHNNESKSPSGLPVSSVFIQYVWDLAIDRFSTATGTNAERSELIWAVNSAIDPKNRGGALYRVIPARKTTLGKALA